ncbi:MAG: hypothetical protein R3F45_01345 [Gammaproteobacteria bacterium]
MPASVSSAGFFTCRARPGDDTFGQFRHDANLGTDDEWEFFNTDEADSRTATPGPRLRQLHDRPTLSMELQSTLPMTYFAQSRFRFALQAGDFNERNHAGDVVA